MHKRDKESILISTLAEGYTITVACKKAGVSRMFYDRHYKSDIAFRKAVDQSRQQGKGSNEDLILTMHMKKVRDGHWQAIKYGMDKLEKKEEAQSKTGKILHPGDIFNLIEGLPEPHRTTHYTHMRELLDLATAVAEGRSTDPDPDGL